MHTSTLFGFTTDYHGSSHARHRKRNNKKFPEERKGYPFASVFTRVINVYALRFYPETGVKRSLCKLMKN